VAVEEAQEAPDVAIGMFLINDTSAVVLFDSRAPHYFISAAYVGKHNLPLALLRCQMIVSSPGGDMPAKQLRPKVNLKIRAVDFVANLIVLESKGIDVIIGMDWCTYRLCQEICQDDYSRRKRNGVYRRAGGHHQRCCQLCEGEPIDASQGLEVPVVNEFPNVFLEELPVMPPDRDIEFVIELKPDTTPIYKTPYRMATLELAESKEHVKKLLEKGFIHPNSSPWVVPKGCARIIVP
jgi:hypothetical protein